MKTSELTNRALDWAVAKCEGFDTRNNCEVEFVNPQDRITVMSFACMADDEYHAIEQLQDAYTEPEFLSAFWHDEYTPSTDWAQGGPIIEREKIGLFFDRACGNRCAAKHITAPYQIAQTPLIAAMRCYVSSKLGDDVEIPKELVGFATRLGDESVIPEELI